MQREIITLSDVKHNMLEAMKSSEFKLLIERTDIVEEIWREYKQYIYRMFNSLSPLLFDSFIFPGSFLLTTLFPWDKSEQGFDYWYELHTLCINNDAEGVVSYPSPEKWE
jgi:hypothetical protein